MNWIDEIQKDLTAFCDRGSSVNIDINENKISARWTSRRTNHNAIFFLDDNNNIDVEFENLRLSYRSFLSHPAMSDLLGIAMMILTEDPASFFVDTHAIRPFVSENSEPARSLINKAIIERKMDQTTVVFMNGDAGSGKTEILKQIVYDQAELFSKGQTDFLYLYVNAQGRALARLDEALATEIQDLKASSLTYHVVPSLARNGVLIPIIDGFDELLGVLGYEDSFSSLRRFLDDLNGRGAIVASARSTYYQQEFLNRNGRQNTSQTALSIDPIDIVPWTEKEFRSYITNKYSYDIRKRMIFDVFKDRMQKAFSGEENFGLQGKPFFVSKVSDLVLEGSEIVASNLIGELVKGYIERERTQKLLDRNGTPLLTATQIEAFLQSVSDEMWSVETRSLDSETVRILAELSFLDADFSDETKNILRERAPTMALFSPAAGRNRVEFEHSLFFSFFLSSTIASSFLDSADVLFSNLNRGIMPENASSFTVNRLHGEMIGFSEFASKCSEVGKLAVSRAPQVRENVGSMMAAFFRKELLLNYSIIGNNDLIFGLIFSGEYIGKGSIAKIRFEETEFNNCDLTSVKFKECKADRLTFRDSIVDISGTNFDFSGVNPVNDIFGLKIRSNDRIEQIYRHDLIAATLVKCGLNHDLDIDDARYKIAADSVDLIERIMKKFERSNMFWPTDHDNRQIVAAQSWNFIERALIESGVVHKESSIAHQGLPRYALRRRFPPHQIMRGDLHDPNLPPSIARFWEMLGEESL